MLNSTEKLKKHKNTPTTIIIGGDNALASNLVFKLIRENGFVVVVDEYSASIEARLKHYWDNELFLFVDRSKFTDFSKLLESSDYILFLAHNIIGTDTADTHVFAQTSTLLSSSLQLSLEHRSKFLLIDSLRNFLLLNSKVFHGLSSKKNDTVGFSNMEFQKYLESLVVGFARKYTIDAKVVRVGEILGDKVDISGNDALKNMFTDAITNGIINVHGDGLDINYLINIEDVTLGVLKVLFNPKYSGQILALANNNPITSLSIAYKIKELEPNCNQIAFVDSGTNNQVVYNTPLVFAQYTPKFDIAVTIAQTIDHYYKELDLISQNDAVETNVENNPVIAQKSEPNNVIALNEEDLSHDNQVDAVSQKKFTFSRENSLKASTKYDSEVESKIADHSSKFSIKKKSIIEIVNDSAVNDSSITPVFANQDSTNKWKIASWVLAAIFVLIISFGYVVPMYNDYSSLNKANEYISSEDFVNSRNTLENLSLSKSSFIRNSTELDTLIQKLDVLSSFSRVTEFLDKYSNSSIYNVSVDYDNLELVAKNSSDNSQIVGRLDLSGYNLNSLSGANTVNSQPTMNWVSGIFLSREISNMENIVNTRLDKLNKLFTK